MLSKSLPFLPGHRYTDPLKQNYYKDQLLCLKSNTCLEKPRYLEQIDPYTLNCLRSFNTSVTSQSTTISAPRINTMNPSYPRTLPQWLKYDKRVLKFDGYFVEHVNESAHENYRIRDCNLLYYLEDDTVQIKEIKVANSGMPQGEFIKRHRALKNNTEREFVTWEDLNLRQNIVVYGKAFRICSCDEFTSAFYKEKGKQLNEPEPIPYIDFGNKYKNVDFEKMKKTIAELKEYTEVGLKGGHPNKSLKQFIENDRKVLHFDITWYDEKYDKEDKHFKLNFYLADNMIEVCEVKVNNSGKDPFPRLLRKSRLPKKPHMSYCPGLEVPEDEYYTPQDLRVGNYITIYNRRCHIVDCDEFTKAWYKENLGIDMEMIKIKKKPPQNIIHPIPPHTGFGSEEDSMLSVKFLNPHGKLHEYVTDKFKRDKHILRYKAVLVSPVPSDMERTFIISFFLRDEAVQVFETAERNSGRDNCKFIERQRMKNPYTNKYYTEKDFVSGNVIYANKFIFKLLDCDEYTKKYMLDNSEIFRDSDIKTLVGRLRMPVAQFKEMDQYLVNLLRIIDPRSQHFVSKEDIDYGMKQFGVYLSQQELITLIDRLRKNDLGYYSMEDLYNLIIGF